MNAALLFGSLLIKYAAKRRDLDGQICILDNGPPPDRGYDLLFQYESAGSLDQHSENIEGSRTDRYGNKNAALIAPREPLALPIEAKFLEQENVPGGEHAPVSRLSRGRRPHPLGLVESLSDGLRAARLRRFRGICRIFAIFLFPFSRPTRPALGTLGDARMPKEEHAVCEGR